jgi:hypothetical protein
MCYDEKIHKDLSIYLRNSWRFSIFDTDKNLDKIINDKFSLMFNDFDEYQFFKNYKNNCIDLLYDPTLFNDIYVDYAEIFNELERSTLVKMFNETCNSSPFKFFGLLSPEQKQHVTVWALKRSLFSVVRWSMCACLDIDVSLSSRNLSSSSARDSKTFCNSILLLKNAKIFFKKKSLPEKSWRRWKKHAMTWLRSPRNASP